MTFQLSAQLGRHATALAASLVFVGFAVSASQFAGIGNLLAILTQASPVAILALGLCIALTCAELDLSFASVSSLAATVTGLTVRGGAGMSGALLAGVGTGLAFGMANGLLVTTLRIPAALATLATAGIANSAAFWLADGAPTNGRWPPGFTSLGRGALGGLPAPVIWMVMAALLTTLLLRHTRLGVHLAAVGMAAEAANLAGLPTAQLKAIGLTLSGVAAGVAAVLLSAELSSANPGMASDDLLPAIASVSLGMTMFQPGRPNVAGTLVGALAIGMLGNGLVLMGASYYVLDACAGCLIIVPIALSRGVLTRAALRL